MITLGLLREEMPSWFLRTAFFAFGLLWGSFLNVVIYRVPRGMSVVKPASHCPGCGKPIAAYDNIPVFTYVILRGRARCCGVKMSPRYPLVELIGGAISLAIFEVIVNQLPDGVSLARAAAIYGADFFLALGLVSAAFIDLEHMILPDSITFGGIVLGVVTSSLRDLPIQDSLLGAVIAFVVIWLPFIFLYKGLLGRTGMGMGDAKLLALAGAWFGWQGAVFVLFAGALQGTVVTLALIGLRIKLELPAAVQEDIAALRKAAAEGDEEAKQELLLDPLTEDEDDAFIVRWIGRLWRRVTGRPEPVAEEKETAPPAEEIAEEAHPPRPRIPFGPFLILACLELLLAGGFIMDRVHGFLSGVIE